MGHLCDFCGEQRSMVYCRSDAACLCLSCDRNVHSANALSRRHSRTLLCERCNSQPATVRCIEEKISLCQNCDWTGHGSSTPVSRHKRQTINCYSGCPSASELSRIWLSIIELTALDESDCKKGMGLMGLTERSVSNSLIPLVDNSTLGRALAGETYNSGNVYETSPPRSAPNSMLACVDHRIGTLNLPTPKLCFSGMEGLGAFEDDDLYDDFNLADFDVNEELLCLSESSSEHFFENGGICSLFAERDMSGVDSNVQGPSVAEVHPSHTLSFFDLSDESGGGDHQNCEVSPKFLMGEPPWYPPFPENSLPSASRDKAVLRYKEKKKTRKFEKKIKYASRKARADIRKRVKGRFVKAGDAYDYDPLCQKEVAKCQLLESI